MRWRPLLLLWAALATAHAEQSEADPWADWQTILYQARTPAQRAALLAIGLTGGMVFANRDDPAHLDLAPMQRDLPYYVENIATDYYAAYHRWRPDRVETADFLAAKRRHREAPQDLAAFTRAPSLSDPAAFRPVHDRLLQTVRAHTPAHPLYYSLADEPGIADLAAAWDFDFAPASLAAFRAWLMTQYSSLDALNQEWGAGFTRWDDVVPATTDEAVARPDENFAAWADFKQWMDVAFARAVRAGTDAIHEADPHALSAIEGAQIPGWGGYDYSRLAQAVDVMELYDFGQNVAMARSFNPALKLLTTVSGGDAQQIHALWRAALQGARGTILWDADDTLATRDGALGEDGRRLAPAVRTLHDGVGALLIHSLPEAAPVAILASQASFRTEWMLDRRQENTGWADRTAEAEYADTSTRVALRGFSQALAHLGIPDRIVSPDMLLNGVFAGGGDRVLILPHTIALSPAEAHAVTAFAGAGGTVLADIVPGAFDSHSRRQNRPALAGLFPDRGALFPLDTDDRDPVALARLAAALGQAGVGPDFRLSAADGRLVTDVAVFRYRFGAVTLYALHRDQLAHPAARPELEMVRLTLPQPRSIYVLQTPGISGRAVGHTAQLDLGLDPVTPTLLAMSDTPLNAPKIAAPARAPLGSGALVQLHIETPTVVHIAVTDPAGAPAIRSSGNLVAATADTAWHIPFSSTDLEGAWTVTATDVASGLRASIKIDAIAADSGSLEH